MKLTKLFAVLFVNTAVLGCATYGSEHAPAGDANVLTHTQLMSNHFASAYDAVFSLRANWLEGRSPHMAGGGVQVYLDNVRLGGIESLRSVDIRTVSYIRRQDSFDSSARWGPGPTSNAIYISTHPVVSRLGRSNEQ
jgi:hypothetical protein